MESSWRQLAVLTGYGDAQTIRLAKLITPIGVFTHIGELRGWTPPRPFLTHLDTGGWMIDEYPPLDFLPGHFPWGYEVLPDDLFPVPWP